MRPHAWGRAMTWRSPNDSCDTQRVCQGLRPDEIQAEIDIISGKQYLEAGRSPGRVISGACGGACYNQRLLLSMTPRALEGGGGVVCRIVVRFICVLINIGRTCIV